MTFRRRRRVNWITVIGLIIGFIGISSLLYQHYGLPKGLNQRLNQLPMFPKPTATATPRVDDGAALFADADKLFSDGKLDQAVEQYDLAATAAERAQTDLLVIADKLDAAGNKTDAATRRTDAQNALARASKGYIGSCRILALRQKTGDAAARCNRAIELDARSAEAYAFLALTYDRANDFDKAIAAAQRAVDLNPDLAEGYAFLAEAYADKSAFDKRNLETAQKAVAANDKSPFAYRNLGWVYETEGNYLQAAKNYQKATELMPNLSYFYIDLCRGQKARGLMAEATAACQKATDLDGNSAEPYDRLGQLYYEQQLNQNALTQFQKAAEIDPTYAMAYTHVAWVYYFRMYAWEKATAAFERALELGQGKFSAALQAELHTELGWSYYRLGRCSDARQAFDKALTLIKQYPEQGLVAVSQQANEGIAACQGKK